MKSQRIAYIAFLCTLPAASLAGECSEFKEGSTPWATCQSAQVFTNTDKSLNTTYRKVLSEFNGPSRSKERQSLIASQRAWLSFRERQCEFAQLLANGAGSATLLDCKADLTKERTEFLERLLKDL